MKTLIWLWSSGMAAVWQAVAPCAPAPTSSTPGTRLTDPWDEQ